MTNTPMTVPSETQQRPMMGTLSDWLRLIGATIAEMYLIMTLTLVAIALLPAVLGWQATVVQTGSMRPHIDPGDVVVAAPWSSEQPVPVGGVVSFRSPAEAEPDGIERIRLHRIVEDRGDGTFTTAGDANAVADSTPLSPEQITGQARLLVPYIGLPSLWVRTGQIGPLLLWGVGTMLALGAVYRNHRADDDEDADSAATEPRAGDRPSR